MSQYRAFIEDAKEACLNGQILKKEEIVTLLSIPLETDDDIRLRNAAYEVALIKRKGKGAIWSAVGLDYDTCPMNCRFCSLGEKWGIVQERYIYQEDEILSQVRHYVEGGASYIVLRTTEFFQLRLYWKWSKPSEQRFLATITLF